MGKFQPERLRCEEEYDDRSDVWSLGITLWETFTGEHPYQYSQLGTDKAIISHEELSLDDDYECSAEFRAFLTACLQKKVELRPKIAKLIVSIVSILNSCRVTKEIQEMPFVHQLEGAEHPVLSNSLL